MRAATAVILRREPWVFTRPEPRSILANPVPAPVPASSLTKPDMIGCGRWGCHRADQPGSLRSRRSSLDAVVVPR